ncbi:MAG TPA: oligoendopeptidase F [Anaerolineales bacterium]|nr:oligoendopeptidase F [Anaerolineales bacterium]
MSQKIRTRAEIPAKYKWSAASVYPSDEAWEAEADALVIKLENLKQMEGSVGKSAANLADALDVSNILLEILGKVLTYAFNSQAVDNANANAARMWGKAQGVLGQVLAGIGFIQPEILAIQADELAQWRAEEPRLQVYRQYFDDLIRQQAHVRSAEVEEVFGLAQDPIASLYNTMNVLTNSELQYPNALTADGKELAVTQGTLDEILASPDREARRTAWEGFRDTHLAFKNTLGSNLLASVKANVFAQRVRQYPSTLEGALFANNIPPQVFHNLIETTRKHLPVWHKYWRVRRQALGQENLQPYDIWAPLTKERVTVPYETAVEWICDGLAPLGEEYVSTARRGLLEEGWVDVYPNLNKSAAQFSSGSKGTHPFIVILYDDTIFSMSTLAHELGHSMHSYLTWKHQPNVYASYSLFAAEVASNFNQAMVRAHLLKTTNDPQFQISLLEEAFSNFHRYFFIMPTLARFELEVHQRVERGQGVTADDMNALMADLFAEGYGSEMQFDRERTGITWATFGHLYQDYYVFQYSTGISGAHALSRRVLSGVENAADDYLRFLSAGSSLYPLDALRLAGVDMSTPQPVEETFEILAQMVDRLAELTAVKA